MPKREFLHEEAERMMAEAESAGRDPAQAVADVRFVNAVECLDPAGNGRLVYVDWP